MFTKRKLLPASLLVAVASALSINQAQAMGDNEAAILVGVAVGGLTTYALQQHDRHHHNHGGYEYYERREYREPPRRRCPPQRVEHYVIHNPPQYRQGGYDRVGYRGDYGHHHGYENEYRRGRNF